ncbi:ATP-binding protein [Xanthomonas oryzae]|nr:ATP-binding protein [Xanthomonas oryzae]
MPVKEVQGSGIGLSLVAGIARLHGATIETGEGNDGRGLCVRVVFACDRPVGAAGNQQPAVQCEALRNQTSAQPRGWRGRCSMRHTGGGTWKTRVCEHGPSAMSAVWPI